MEISKAACNHALLPRSYLEMLLAVIAKNATMLVVAAMDLMNLIVYHALLINISTMEDASRNVLSLRKK